MELHFNIERRHRLTSAPDFVDDILSHGFYTIVGPPTHHLDTSAWRLVKARDKKEKNDKNHRRVFSICRKLVAPIAALITVALGVLFFFGIIALLEHLFSLLPRLS